MNSPGTALALPPEVEARIQETRARNKAIALIRSQVWSKDLNHEQQRAVAQYCHENGLDPLRHVEVLGGKIYLTAQLYAERGAPLLQAGIVELLPPRFINADPRLKAMADAGDEWAIQESASRTRERIRHNAPETAEAICVYPIRIRATGMVVEGVNWCGKGLRMKKRRDGSTYDDDPVGGAEPTKTALTRAARRAWLQVAEVVPQMAERISAIEAQATVVSEAVEAAEDDVIPIHRPGRTLAAPADGPYEVTEPVPDEVIIGDAEPQPAPAPTEPAPAGAMELQEALAVAIPGAPHTWGGNGGKTLAAVRNSLLKRLVPWAAAQAEDPNGYRGAATLRDAATVVLAARESGVLAEPEKAPKAPGESGGIALGSLGEGVDV
jgi:hypothetical protein